ncbi:MULTISPECIES: phosphate-starvation-inducible PsiE family protein [Lactococcus]|uniref:phosphate-starvation-inducible PsiE family protein n=1 Tax=Lactococcus TaxID=1357 RepID=UPI00203ACF92|nr:MULTISPECIES: phosphate-starvation-inducible PsiE family protein [Lactococcus]
MKLKIKTMLENALSGILVILGTVMVLALSLQLLDIVRMFIPIKDHLDFIVVVQKVLSFFVFFELVMMIIEYIKDNSITVRYLIYICITAILRQIMTIHNDAIDIIILSGAIFILVSGLAILEVVYKKREENVMIEKKHEKEK